MNNLDSEEKLQNQNRSAVTLKNSFNIIFRNQFIFQGANNNQYFFQTVLGNFKLYGFQQFLLNNQPKMLKKYIRKNGAILLLNKSDDFLLKYPMQTIELWKFDHFHNYKYYQTIYQDADFDIQVHLEEHKKISQIGINEKENMLVFQKFREIYFFNKNEEGFWKIQQTITNTSYVRMHQIRFNESNNIIVAFQTNIFVNFEECEYYLTIIHKNQNQIWQITQHVRQSFDPFIFINDQQFQLFQSHKNLQLIYEISNLDFIAEVKSQLICEGQLEKNSLPFPIQIQSKNLIFLYGLYFLYYNYSKPLKLLSSLPTYIKSVRYIQTHELLLFNVYQCAKGIEAKKFQIYRIYLN